MVRKDIWRALRDLRGFAPVVFACAEPSGVRIKAGGQLVGGLALGAHENRLRAVLEDGQTRARWQRCAR